ncbi:phosphotransferase family protein [Variovorax sp. UMC13]|uniref:phosphotransferase family protein n=1 Tax=Variovorax sp. UMC13 TaxID=1862326 RepID=UPI001603ABD8|nr:phosphotransferase family protein [Variovorax sp. UMC13]
MDEPEAIAAALQAIAARIAPGGRTVDGLRRLSGGASQQTWAFELGTAGEGALPLILRRAPGVQSARDHGSAGLATEAALIDAARALGVPAPAVCHVLQPADGLGEGFVMARIEGETLGRRIVRDERFEPARRVLARQCGQALAKIHRVPLAGLPPLRRSGARAELDFQLALHRGHGTARPVFEAAFQWLRRHAPATEAAPVLVHGDFRNGNLIVGEQGLRAVLDWELAHIGDPMEDLGWLCVNAWRFGRDELPVGGFGTLAELFEGYTAEGGTVDTGRLRYWQVLGTLKWGIVCEAMAHAWLGGSERELEKAVIGRRASEAEIDLLALIAPQGGA